MVSRHWKLFGSFQELKSLKQEIEETFHRVLFCSQMECKYLEYFLLVTQPFPLSAHRHFIHWKILVISRKLIFIDVDEASKVLLSFAKSLGKQGSHRWKKVEKARSLNGSKKGGNRESSFLFFDSDWFAGTWNIIESLCAFIHHSTNLLEWMWLMY